MSPIRPERADLYPANWKAISFRIRFFRAAGRCECLGECGKSHDRADAPESTRGRCVEIHNRDGQFIKGRVVLTCAHLDHDETNSAESNLKAMCQMCHNNYDRAHRAETRAVTRAAKKSKREKAAKTKSVSHASPALPVLPALSDAADGRSA